MAQAVIKGKGLTVGTRIKQAREEAIQRAREEGAPKPTIEYIAAHLGVSSRTVAGWQADRSRPSYERLVELAAVLGKPASFFLGENGQ